VIQINIYDVPRNLEDPDSWWKRVDRLVREVLPGHRLGNCIYDPESQPRLRMEVRGDTGRGAQET
jgi:hypothetical protein